MPRLVLTRNEGEAVWIGDQVKVTILRGPKGQLRLAIDAPASVVILREELRDDAPDAPLGEAA